MTPIPKRILVLLATLVVSAFSGGAVLALEPGEPPDPPSASPAEYAPGEVLLAFEANATENQKKKAKEKVKAKQKEKIYGTEVEVLQVEGATEAAVKALEGEPGVEGAQPNFFYRPMWTPNDPFYTRGDQYYLGRVRAWGAWQNAKGEIGGTSNPEIGILDGGWDNAYEWGYADGHPDLKTKVTGQYDCAYDDPYAEDPGVYGHGTNVAGIAAATTNNGTGVASVAPDADLFVGKFVAHDGIGRTSDLIQCGNRAIGAGVEVLNISTGSATDDPLLRDAVAGWIGKNVNVVAAAGNNGANGCPSHVVYPAAYPNVIGVGATDSNNVRASFSGCGTRVDVVAPGVAIQSTGQGGYVSMSGTSQAAPQVAGAVALARSNGYNSEAQARNRIYSTARDLGPAGYDIYYGRGLLDADAATGPN